MTAVGFLAIARTTFDVPFAEQNAQAAHSALTAAPGVHVTGDAELATDADSVGRATEQFKDQNLDALVVFQATFADSTLIASVSESVDVPLVLWATPEERTGGRLRLNSFCGINLAAYVLARDGVDYRWVYRAPYAPDAAQLVIDAANGPGRTPPSPQPAKANGSPVDLTGRTVGVLGQRPDGFEPCDFEAAELDELFGISVEQVDLDVWFDAATDVDQAEVDSTRAQLEAEMTGLGSVEADSLDRSLRLALGLSQLADKRSWSGVATRCWPECFTEFGGAACAGNSMMTSAGKPGCCEADVYGNITALLLQEVSGEAPLVADLIDLEPDGNTAVFWHCGLAPKEMVKDGEKASATVHSNRKKPLLNEFALKPGRVTIARLSQARHTKSILIGTGDMVDAPLPFSGTSGVCRLDSSVDSALDTILGGGLEHHYGIVYGDHTGAIEAFADAADIPVLRL